MTYATCQRTGCGFHAYRSDFEKDKAGDDQCPVCKSNDVDVLTEEGLAHELAKETS